MIAWLMQRQDLDPLEDDFTVPSQSETAVDAAGATESAHGVSQSIEHPSSITKRPDSQASQASKSKKGTKSGDFKRGRNLSASSGPPCSLHVVSHA